MREKRREKKRLKILKIEKLNYRISRATILITKQNNFIY